MTRLLRASGLAISLIAGLVPPDSAAEETPPDMRTLKIGDPAPDFSLPGIDGRDWALSDFRWADVLMVVFTSNHCPVSHAAEPRLIKLVEELKTRSFAVVAINPNNPDGVRIDELGYSKYGDSFEEMKPYAKEAGFTFPYLYDGATQATAKAYGCLATPHVFVFDKARTLRYQGWLDDSRFADPATVKRADARNAVLALFENQPVPVPVTKPFGCSTKWLEKKAAVTEADASWEKAPVTLESIDADGLAALVKNNTGKFRLFNVWATTCAPCVQEFPGLIRISRRMGLRDFELITISADDPDDRGRIVKFLTKHQAALPARLKAGLATEGRASNNYVYTGANIGEFIEALDREWDGALPHTVMVAPGGKVAFRVSGAISEERLLARVLEVMNTTYQPDKP